MSNGELLTFLKDMGGPVKLDMICFSLRITQQAAIVLLKQLEAGEYVMKPARGYYMATGEDIFKPPAQHKKVHVCPPGICTHCRAERLRELHKQGGHTQYIMARGHIVS